MRILFICGALAAGEYAASFVPTISEVWPLAAMLAVVVSLFGYGLHVCGWPLVAVFLLGVSAFLWSSVGSERLYREQPWMRGQLQYGRGASVPREGLVAEVRADISRRVGLGLGHDGRVEALNRAILLGERSRLPKEVKQVFVASGTMHVFAISGLHVMAVALVLVYLLACLLVPIRLAGAVAIPLLWGYVYLVGLTPSAVRAALMASICFLAPVFWRRANLLRAWSLTFLLVHLVRPQMITDVGNALSFAVMLSIALVVEWGRRGVCVPPVGIAVLAWAVGVPICAHVFGQVAPGGILANLVLITAAEWTVVSGAIGVVASFASETVAVHFNNLSALCTKAMVGVAECVARLPFSHFEVPRWTLLDCAEWYALLVLVVFLIHSIHQRKF